MGNSDEMSPELLRAIRARLDEPPPLLALAERHRGQTALVGYLTRLQADRIALVDEIDRLRAELDLARDAGGPERPQPGQRPIA